MGDADVSVLVLQIKAVKTGTVFWSSLAALAYFYMVSTGLRRQANLTQGARVIQITLSKQVAVR